MHKNNPEIKNKSSTQWMSHYASQILFLYVYGIALQAPLSTILLAGNTLKYSMYAMLKV